MQFAETICDAHSQICWGEKCQNLVVHPKLPPVVSQKNTITSLLKMWDFEILPVLDWGTKLETPPPQ